MTPAIRRHVDESRLRFQQSSAKLGHDKMEMTHRHREGRSKLEERQCQEWDAQTRQRNDRLPKGMRGLWHRITGRYQDVRAANEADAQAGRARQADERQALIDRQRSERAVLQADFKALRTRQTQELLELRREVGRFLQFSRGLEPSQAQKRSVSIGLKLER
jgi:hypothetical protein